MVKTSPYIRWFNELTLSDIAIVGGKNASLGEMYQELTAKDIYIPNGLLLLQMHTDTSWINPMHGRNCMP